ncbi:hypothetical protein HDU76_003128, partial [Blyttiomyces sp. JEL0837]
MTDISKSKPAISSEKNDSEKELVLNKPTLTPAPPPTETPQVQSESETKEIKTGTEENAVKDNNVIVTGPDDKPVTAAGDVGAEVEVKRELGVEIKTNEDKPTVGVVETLAVDQLEAARTSVTELTPMVTNENAWKIAKTQGISAPVINTVAAAAMNPLKPSVSQTQLKSPPIPHNPNLASLPKVKPDHILPTELQMHINQFRIDGFAQKYFSEHRRGIFRRKVPIEQMLLFQKESLKSPLMTLPKPLHKDALRCFKTIQKIMNDTSKGPPYPSLTADIQSLMQKGILQGGLRDEIYVQLCKQVNRNPSFQQTFRGWLLMCVISIGFPPSKNFEDYLKSFVSQYFDGIPSSWVTENTSNGKDNSKEFASWVNGEDGKKIGVLAKHCYKKLVRICKAGPRGKVPTVVEVEKAQEAPFEPALFGETLEDVMRAQYEEELKVSKSTGQPENHLELPKILTFLTDAVLNLNGRQTEGIFRVPGDIDMVNDLRCRIEKGKYDITGITDPNVPSSLLKLWLRDLAEPIIPADKYDECIAVGHEEHNENAAIAAIDIIKTIPDINKNVLVFMIKFLRIVADPANHKETKMTAANVAMVFAPNFLRCPSNEPQVIFENT